MMPAPRDRKFLVVLRQDQDKALDRAARREGKTRSAVVRDALDRMFTPVPDADSDSPGIYPRD